MKKSFTKRAFLSLILLSVSINVYGQSKYSSGLYLKSIQADFTSLVLINGASVYSDIDIFKEISEPRSFGLRLGYEVVDIIPINEHGQTKGYPIRNFCFSVRRSTAINSFQVNGFFSYVNTVLLQEVWEFLRCVA